MTTKVLLVQGTLLFFPKKERLERKDPLLDETFDNKIINIRPMNKMATISTRPTIT